MWKFHHQFWLLPHEIDIWSVQFWSLFTSSISKCQITRAIKERISLYARLAAPSSVIIFTSGWRRGDTSFQCSHEVRWRRDLGHPSCHSCIALVDLEASVLGRTTLIRRGSFRCGRLQIGGRRQRPIYILAQLSYTNRDDLRSRDKMSINDSFLRARSTWQCNWHWRIQSQSFVKTSVKIQ